MFTKLKNKAEGFTIIEVLIVLAIAGLIILIVFLAVPALQRNSRNSSRNTEAARVSASVTECLANRNGVVSSCAVSSALSYGTLNEFGTVNVSNTATAPAFDTTQVGVWFNHTCTSDGSTYSSSGATARSFAVLFQLEASGGNITKCITS